MAIITGAIWEQIRSLIEKQTGTIRSVKPIKDSTNFSFAAIVQTDQKTVFVKGRRLDDDPLTWTLARERAINPAVRHVTPWLLWSTSNEEWDLLGFEYVNGWHANYKPGSPDLPKVERTLLELQRTECPDVELMQAEQRWAAYTDTPDLFAGGHLLHTDLSPGNVLINGRAYLVDWAWPTKGAAWIDPACWTVRLIAAGHPPQSAETWAARIPSWNDAPLDALNSFAHVQAAVWNDLAAKTPDPWIKTLAKAAWLWTKYRDVSPGAADRRRRR